MEKGFSPVLILIGVTVVVSAVFLTTQTELLTSLYPKSESTPINIPQTPQPSPTPFIDQTSDWKTYNNDKYEFSFKYPTDFNFVKEVQGTGPTSGILFINFEHKNYNADQKDAYGKPNWEGRRFSIGLRSNNESLENYIKKYFELSDFHLGKFSDWASQERMVEEIKEINVNGNRFISVHIPGAADGTTSYYIQEGNTIASIANGYIYFIDDETFNQILSTFKFTK